MAGFLDIGARLATVDPTGKIPNQQIDAPAGAFGPDGRQMQQAGAQLDRASENTMDLFKQEAGIANKTRVQDLNNQFVAASQGIMFTNPDAYLTKQGEDAIHATKPTVDSLNALKDKLLGQTANDAQRLALQDKLDFHVADATQMMSRHVATQALVVQKSVAWGTITNGTNEMVLNYNDPAKVELHAQGVWKTAYDLEMKTSGSPEAAKAQADAVRSNAFKAVIIRQAADDPGMAQRTLEQASKSGFIDASDAPGLANTIKDASQTRQAKNIVGLVTATGGISPDYNAKVGVAENGGNYQGENKIGALGKYQMIPSTYTGLAQETDWGKGKSQSEIRALLLDPKTGPALQDQLQGKYNDKSVTALGKAGVPVNDLTLYTTHFLGQSAGPELLKLPDDTPLSAGLVKASGGEAGAKAVMDANPFLAKVNTVGDLRALMAQKIGAPSSLATAGTPQKPNLDAMLASGLQMAGNDPDLRDKVTQAIKTDYATKAAIYTQQIGTLEKRAFDHITAGGSIENLPTEIRAGLDADGMTKVTAFETRVLEKRRHDNAEAAGKSLTDLDALGQLTLDDVKKAEKLLPANEYQAWTKKASGLGRTEDPGTYERLQRGLGTRDMRDDLFASFNAGDINRESLDKLLEKNAIFQKEGAPATPYKIGHDYVTHALDPGLMGSGISREIAGRAIKEYDQYVAANPQREGEAPEAYGKRLDQFATDTVKRHQLIKTSEMAVAIPVPAHAAFERSQMTALPKPEASKKIAGSMQELTRNFDGGKITQDQYDADTLVLMQWKKFVDDRVDAAPPPAKK